MVEQRRIWSDNGAKWLENVQCPTVISGSALCYMYVYLAQEIKYNNLQKISQIAGKLLHTVYATYYI